VYLLYCFTYFTAIIDKTPEMNALYLKISFLYPLLNAILILNAQTIQVSRLAVDHLYHADFQVINGYPVIGFETGGEQQVRIANKNPVLGWELLGAGQGARQSAYRIILSNSPDSIAKGVGDVWDSEKVAS